MLCSAILYRYIEGRLLSIMEKKKAIKIATATAIAATGFVAAAPEQSEAAVSLATQIKNAKAAMKKPYDTYVKSTVQKPAAVKTVKVVY